MLVILPRGCDSERAVIRNDRNVVLERTFGKHPSRTLVNCVTSGYFLKHKGQDWPRCRTERSRRIPPTNPADDPRDEAVSWLSGQFRWESLLADLHELAEEQRGEESAA